MQICVIGTGYVGLVTGACLADFGVDVTCVDKDEGKIEMLRDGEMPIYEPGLESLVARNVEAERLYFTTDLSESIRRATAVFIAVGTPPRPDGSADLSFVVEVAEAIADNMEGYTVVVTKSTVPIGTGQLIEGIIREHLPDGDAFSVVSNPEFLREGSAIEDFMRPDRVVIGARDPRAIEIMKEIYSPLYLIETPFVITGVETSELIKYASNAFLATKITFINEVAELCERLDADVHEVARAMGLDGRISPKFLHPGPGYGGSCFPKDTEALADIARQAGTRFAIIETVIEVNERMKRRGIEKTRRLLGDDLSGKTLAVLGLAFKPGTDDMRESSAIPLVEDLVERGGRIQAYDPAAMERAGRILPPSVRYCEDVYQALDGADAAIIVTEWNEFRSLDLERARELMDRPLVIDLRNVYDPSRMRERGFDYEGVGRGLTATDESAEIESAALRIADPAKI